MPTTPCGCTDDQSEYYALFPHWASEDDIFESKYGLPMPVPVPVPMPPVYLVRPEHWPECDQREKCDFFNELACKCFSEEQCSLWCGDGKTLDPTKGCSCISEEEARAIYPEWASEKDINVSLMLQYELQPMQEPMPPVLLARPDHWPLCEGELPVCIDPEMFNELACKCFMMLQCDMRCGEDSTNDPINGCSCIPNSEVVAYYPEWASEEDIDVSWELSYQAYAAKFVPPVEVISYPTTVTSVWPACNPMPMCIQDTYFNELSCQCWPLIQCEIGCPEFLSPASICDCLSADEYYSLFPEWATKDDISFSFSLNKPRYFYAPEMDGSVAIDGSTGPNTNDAATAETAWSLFMKDSGVTLSAVMVTTAMVTLAA